MSYLPLLIELGTEELPVKALPGLAQALFDGVVEGLGKRGIAFEREQAKPLYTPRRLAVLLPKVAKEQPQKNLEVLGPYASIALDAAGEPTQALKGFASKVGVDWTALERTHDSKGERFVFRSIQPGVETVTLLPEILEEALAGMPIPKPMRWGAHEYGFARPVHWLVMLLGTEVVPMQVFGVDAGRVSHGHRFMAGQPISLAQAEDYVEALQQAYVLVDADVRAAKIRQQANALAGQVKGGARITEDNLQQVVCLTEWPGAVMCSFDSAFLKVPHEALIETMEVNQKFFPVFSGSGQLTEHFIGIANIESKEVRQVREGYERVIRPRFADAQFFFEEDLKQGLAAMGEGLAGVMYQAKLGSVADKVQRVVALAGLVAQKVGADVGLAQRAAELSKNDLQSLMVGEFPELQGIAGRHYAAAQGEPEEVALAVDEAYQPRFAGDDIALSSIGKVLAIAERLDTLAGGFVAGLKPTGNKDPFGLRRNALGLARTIIESGYELDLGECLGAALVPFKAILEQPKTEVKSADKKVVAVNAEQLADELYGFIVERLRGYYVDKKVPTTHFNAVAQRQPRSLYDFDRRVEAVGVFAAMPEAEALAAANKRIGNILRKVDESVSESVDPFLVSEPAELALMEAVDGVIANTDGAFAKGEYIQVLGALAQLRPQVDAFFDEVMVNAEDLQVRANRLALLNQLFQRLGSVAAIENLSN